MLQAKLTVFLVLLSNSLVLGWSQIGHSVVASLAQDNLDANALKWARAILGDDLPLRLVSSYADSFRFLSGNGWASPQHYIDIQDKPDQADNYTCGLVEERDCPAGSFCITSAIQNYTTQLCNPTLQKDALQFLIHFYGDLTQPLHNAYRNIGGNSIIVNWEGSAKSDGINLHEIWDTQLLHKRVQDLPSRTDDYVQSYHDHLSSLLKTTYTSSSSKWISNVSFNSSSPLGNNLAALEYSRDSDTFDCSYVFPAYDSNPTADLSTTYYMNAVPIIDMQLAKGGLRLAHHLNQAFQSCQDLGLTPSTGGEGVIAEAIEAFSPICLEPSSKGGDCAIGNLITDCMISQTPLKADLAFYPSSTISGGISKGSISASEVESIVYSSKLQFVNFSGVQLLSQMSAWETSKVFSSSQVKLQLSGGRIDVNPQGNLTLLVGGEVIIPTRNYVILATDYIFQYTGLFSNTTGTLLPTSTGLILNVEFGKCLGKRGKITPLVEGRITFSNGTPITSPSTSSTIGYTTTTSSSSLTSSSCTSTTTTSSYSLPTTSGKGAGIYSSAAGSTLTSPLLGGGMQAALLLAFMIGYIFLL